MQIILSKRGFSASKVRFLKANHLLCWIVPTPSITQMFTFPYNLVMKDIKINRQNSLSSKMSIRCSRASHLLVWEVIVGYFHFRATVQCLLVPQTFWTGEIQLALLYFLRFQTIIHGWHDNCAIFPPSVFHYYIFFWIFFSATTIWLMELVFLINPVRLGKLVVLSRNVV